MKNLIVYTTRHGCTAYCAQVLQQKLGDETQIVDLKHSKLPDLEAFDAVIIGGSIHAGRIQNRIKSFCQRHMSSLLRKKVGLFLCCMEQGDKAQQEFTDAYPADLIAHATATGIFGGEFNFEKMNFLERAIVKKVAGIDQSVSKIDETAIADFVKRLQ